MSSNTLKLNGDEIETMIIGSKSETQPINIPSIQMCNDQITLTDKVRNLGVFIDSNHTMNQHISQVRKICYLELRRISHIRPYLTPESTNKLVCAFVIPF